MTYMLSVLIRECLSSQWDLSGGCNIATPERDAGECPRDGHSQEGEARDQLANIPNKDGWNRKVTRDSKGGGKTNPIPHPLCTSKDPKSGSGQRRPRPSPYPPRKRREYGRRGAALEEAEVSGEEPNQVLPLSRTSKIRDVLCVLWSQCKGCVVCPLVPM